MFIRDAWETYDLNCILRFLRFFQRIYRGYRIYRCWLHWLRFLWRGRLILLGLLWRGRRGRGGWWGGIWIAFLRWLLGLKIVAGCWWRGGRLMFWRIVISTLCRCSLMMVAEACSGLLIRRLPLVFCILLEDIKFAFLGSLPASSR